MDTLPAGINPLLSQSQKADPTHSQQRPPKSSFTRAALSRNHGQGLFGTLGGNKSELGGAIISESMGGFPRNQQSAGDL
jgi:hypothetical protein